jgi:hypothetical protein
LARFNASKHESVWFNTDIRKSPAFKVIDASAFGLWTRLPFLTDDHHVLPGLAVIAKDSDKPEADVAVLLTELESAGLVESFADDCFHMTALSRQFYSFTEPTEAQSVDEEE